MKESRTTGDGIHTPLEQAKTSVLSAKIHLVETYCSELSRQYVQSDEQQRERILTGLERLVTDTRRQQKQVSAIDPSFFDPVEARSTRADTGLSIPELAKHLNPDNWKSMRVVMNNFEVGLNNPSYPPRGNTRTYLLWLKEQGYNPYKI